MEFDLPKEKSSIIKVIGIGGGGNNAVNHMYREGITGVNFVICNTDEQALNTSPIPVKVHLGPSLTEGMGAGNDPSKGREATEESIEDIRAILEVNTKMVFITAGMGGGTGTGGAAVVARLAKEMGILTVAIVTAPFDFEGRQRIIQAEDGIAKLKDEVDTLIVVSNNKLREVFGNLTLKNAFSKADDILSTAAKGIAEIITVPGYVNVDFEDVRTVMRDSGVAIMGMGIASGEGRSLKAVDEAINSPLLNDNDINGAQNILINIISGKEEVLMDEISDITDYVQDQAGNGANIIWGNCSNDSLEDELIVTVIATGFETSEERTIRRNKTEKVIRPLNDTTTTETTFDFGSEEEVGELSEEEEPVLKTETEINPAQEIKFDFSASSYEKVKDEATNQLDFLETNEEEETRKAEKMEMMKKNQERINKLRGMTRSISSDSTLSELENEPAYLRRKVELEDTPHSSESQVSRFTLDETEDWEGEDSGLKSNNSFLHDNVD